jgi:hypothetical protein
MRRTRMVFFVVATAVGLVGFGPSPARQARLGIVSSVQAGRNERCSLETLQRPKAKAALSPGDLLVGPTHSMLLIAPRPSNWVDEPAHWDLFRTANGSEGAAVRTDNGNIATRYIKRR